MRFRSEEEGESSSSLSTTVFVGLLWMSIQNRQIENQNIKLKVI